MKVETYACDQCKTQKKEANHWWCVYEARDGHDTNAKAVIIAPWSASALTLNDSNQNNAIGLPNSDNDAAHLCGADCVTQWLSKNLL